MGSLTNPATPLQQFAAPNTPLEPTQLRQGDTWNWERAFANYPSSLYRLKYILNSVNNRFVLDGSLPDAPPITAADDGQGFVIQAPAALTNGCMADTYQIAAVLTGIEGSTAAGQQATLLLQDVLVEPNLGDAAGPVDTRSFVKVRLDMIEACMRGDQRPDVQEYMISGRQLRKYDPEKLESMRKKYLAAYQAELRAKGQYARRRVLGFRFRPSI